MEELIEEEKIEVRTETAEKLIAKGKMTFEDIAECLSLPLEKIKEIAVQLQPQMA